MSAVRLLHPLSVDATIRSRREIEAEIERLIEMLDLADGDCDLEDDDPAGDPLDNGEDEPWRPEGFALPLPRYDLDQSAGPINEREAVRAFHRFQMEVR